MKSSCTIIRLSRLEPWGDQKEAKKERSVTRQQAVADGLLLKPGELQIPEGKQVHGASTNASKMEQEEYQQETQLLKADPPTKSASPSQLYSEGTVQSHLTPSQLLDSTSDQRNHKSFFRQYVENELMERRARRKVREQVFGTISASKCHPFGTICSPFKALAIMEMQKLTLPQDSPMTSQIPNKETVCTTESDVRSLQLTFPRLDREQAETSSLKEKQQPAGQTKTPWLPPLVNPTKASLSSSRQAKRCQLPSLLPEQPFLPWKSRY
ncbi:uncharacterized protein [Apteryx mantelli]|uniref:Uncharacterized protein isoform X2 n=1 Tax=Apteryx mantelli TaxID=2696672 RepID=A0A8B7IM71_9AVES|nr:PREDICTED: uncharacterized protein LOC106485980 isoform X2 [Apteryx mantelli mantelli]